MSENPPLVICESPYLSLALPAMGRPSQDLEVIDANRHADDGSSTQLYSPKSFVTSPSSPDTIPRMEAMLTGNSFHLIPSRDSFPWASDALALAHFGHYIGTMVPTRHEGMLCSCVSTILCLDRFSLVSAEFLHRCGELSSL